MKAHPFWTAAYVGECLVASCLLLQIHGRDFSCQDLAESARDGQWLHVRLSIECNVKLLMPVFDHSAYMLWLSVVDSFRTCPSIFLNMESSRRRDKNNGFLSTRMRERVRWLQYRECVEKKEKRFGLCVWYREFVLQQVGEPMIICRDLFVIQTLPIINILYQLPWVLWTRKRKYLTNDRSPSKSRKASQFSKMYCISKKGVKSFESNLFCGSCLS